MHTLRHCIALAIVVAVSWSAGNAAAEFGKTSVTKDDGMDLAIARCGPGWTDGDSTYSVPILPAGKVAFFSSDFFMGRVSPSDSVARFVQGNALNVLDINNPGGPMVTYFGTSGTTTATRNSYPLVPYSPSCPKTDPGTGGAYGYFRFPNNSCTIGGKTYAPCAYWAGDLYVDDYLRVNAFLRVYEFQNFPNGHWIDTRLGTVDINNLAGPQTLSVLPSWNGVMYGAGVMKISVGGTAYVYIYGTRNNYNPSGKTVDAKYVDPSNSKCHGNCVHLARAPLNEVNNPYKWQYFAGKNAAGNEIWSTSLNDTRALDGDDVTRFFDKDYKLIGSFASQGPNVNNEFSVTRFENCGSLAACYVMIGHSNEPYTGDIKARWSRSPTGPWSAPVQLYHTPESSSAIFTYNSHAHSWSLSGHTIMISYNVNRVAGFIQSSWEYRPHFIRATLEW